MYADDLEEPKSNENEKKEIKTFWHKDSIKFVKELLEFEKSSPPSKYHKFSNMIINGIKRNKVNSPYYFPITSCNESKWLSGIFIKEKQLAEDTDKKFALNSVWRRIPDSPPTKKNRTRVNHWFKIRNTERGYKLILCTKELFDTEKEIIIAQ